MRKLIVLILMLWCWPAAGADDGSVAAIDEVLDAFHDSASRADGALYFSLFAEDAVFIGTDATERWSVEEFRAFAEPYFSKGHGWTYTKTERHIDLAVSDKTAWFDEMLWNEKYGTCRGTGVLVLTEKGWRVAQYHLTFPIPNELSAEITSRIKELDQKESR